MPEIAWAKHGGLPLQDARSDREKPGPLSFWIKEPQPDQSLKNTHRTQSVSVDFLSLPCSNLCEQFFHSTPNTMISLLAKICKFFILYLVQAACLWIGLEASTYLQGDALKIALQDYWLPFYALPLLTTGLIFKEAKDAPLAALIGWTERQCLAAYLDGERAWQYNQFAFFFRRQWMLYLLIASVLVFLSLHAVFFPDLSSALKNAIILVLAFLFFGGHFVALRKRTLGFLTLQRQLHQLAHQLRNEHSQLLKKFASKEKAVPEDVLRYLAEVLEKARGYLEVITGEKHDMALRIALPHQEEQGNIIYQTLACTAGLEKNPWLEQAVPANEGIPRYLIEERDTCNVLVYRDIKKAIKEQVFCEETEPAFADTIRSLAVAPLKAWDGKKKSMVGMLYISSGRTKSFREEHIDSIRFLADILSDALASSLTVNHMLIMKGNKNARRRQLLEKY